MVQKSLSNGQGSLQQVTVSGGFRRRVKEDVWTKEVILARC